MIKQIKQLNEKLNYLTQLYLEGIENKCYKTSNKVKENLLSLHREFDSDKGLMEPIISNKADGPGILQRDLYFTLYSLKQRMAAFRKF